MLFQYSFVYQFDTNTLKNSVLRKNASSIICIVIVGFCLYQPQNAYHNVSNIGIDIFALKRENHGLWIVDFKRLVSIGRTFQEVS